MTSNKKFKLLLSILFPSIIFLVAAFICFKNYSPGTYLIGWDSLHPEFNFPEAFRRVWEGVYRAEQGVGVVAGIVGTGAVKANVDHPACHDPGRGPVAHVVHAQRDAPAVQ